MDRSSAAKVYAVWDLTTANMLGEFATRAEAEAYIEEVGPLGRFGPDGHDLIVVEDETDAPMPDPTAARDRYCEPAGPCEVECVDGCQNQDAAQGRDDDLAAKREKVVDAARIVAELNGEIRSTYGRRVTSDEWGNAMFGLELAVSAYDGAVPDA